MNARLMRLSVAAGLIWMLAACSSGPGPIDNTPYLDEIRATRADKDRMLRLDKDSPLPAETRASFRGLPYFDIKPEFRVPAVLTEIRGGPPLVIELPQTDGTAEQMRKVGSLGFSLGAAKYDLTAFAEINDRMMEGLFVPFGDLTNGRETYKGGRFLNLKRTATGMYDLDFNQAYHPYCVYNPTWICPVPPRENQLPVAIPAGERLGADKSGK
jgi:uncharacterized protein (DUF1684 family)